MSSVLRYVESFIFFTMMFLGLPLVGSTEEAVHILDQAQFIAVESEIIPGVNRADWKPVDLPDIWHQNHPGYGGTIWYRAVVPLDTLPDQLWAVYLPRINMNAAVYVNGVLIGNGGRFEQPMARNWNRPLYFNVPQTLWQKGENILQLRLQADANCRGGLYPLHVGPESLLKPVYQRALLLQIDLLKILFVLSLCVSLITFVLWLMRRRDDSMYGFYALGTFFWAVYIQYFFVQDISISAHDWMWLTFSSAYGMVISMMLFCQLFMKLKCGWCLKVVPLYGLLTSILLYLTPLDSMFEMIAYSFVGIALFVIYMSVHLVRYAFKHLNFETAMLIFGVLVNVGFGIHDLLTLKLAWSPPNYLLHYGTPVMFFAMGIILLNRFLQILEQSERLNLELDQRVTQKEIALSAMHEALRLVERKEAILTERERMVEDLHDGMGGQLVAALSLVDKPEENSMLKQALENAMLDFRLVVDSLDDDSHDIATLLGMLRMRLEPQFNASGMQLSWQLKDGPELRGVPSEPSLHILRIVQEAITNAIRHSSGSLIGVLITAADGFLIVQVTDNGTGFMAKGQGHGIENMKKRAARIGAELNVESSSLGVAVCLRYPCGD
ncbi:MAG: hypothetical protein Q9M17_00480 [Mariprofundus sp.]|nr:hypothetical protein [Mariprofundus sp.]